MKIAEALKKVLAVLALLCMAAFILSILVLIVTGQMQEKMSLVMIPLSLFLMFGLLALAINWLMKLREEKLREDNRTTGE